MILSGFLKIFLFSNFRVFFNPEGKIPKNDVFDVKI